MTKIAVAAHFAGRDPIVRDIYDRLVEAAKRVGPVTQDPKKTSIHLVRKTAFAGVVTRRDAIVLTLKSPTDIRSRRVTKRLHTSASRWYLEIRLSDPRQVDKQIAAWLERAISISQ